MQELLSRKNYELVLEYIAHEAKTKNHSIQTQKRYYSYLKHLLRWAGSIYFPNVQDIEPVFVKHLKYYISPNTGEPLSRESWRKILGLTARLFRWAKLRKKDFKHFPETWIDYLTIPKAVKESDNRTLVTIEDMLQIATLEIPLEDLALRRDQAAAAMLFLSGMRASAFVTLPIEAVDLENNSIKQWTKLGVRTKNGKSQTTYLFKIQSLLAIVQEWHAYVIGHLPPSAPWYAVIHSNWGLMEPSHDTPGRHRNQLLNKRLRVLFEKAGLPYKSAHKFRRGHLVHGLNHSGTIDKYKAVSENLMHSNITITDQYYGKLTDNDRKKKIESLFEDQERAQPPRRQKGFESSQEDRDLPHWPVEVEEHEIWRMFE
ncbi:tyrosine recombinase XerC [Chloroflexota bacterium]